MRRLALFLLLVAAARRRSGMCRCTRRSRPPKLEYQRLVLPNGLVVILHQDKSTPIVHVELWYHVGSKNEKPGRTGFAHFFEHLMFKGSRNVEPEQHTSIIASVGGQANAYTNEDTTVFWQTIPAQYLPLVLWMEADRMASLRIDQKTFVTRARGRQGRAAHAHRESAVRTAERADHLQRLRRASLQAPGDRQHDRPERGDDRRRARLLQDVLRARKRDDDDRRRLRDRHGVRTWSTSTSARVPKAAKPVPRDIPQEPQHTKEQRVTLEQPWPLPAIVVTYHVPYNGHPDSYPMFVMSKTLSDGRLAHLSQAGLRNAGWR